MHHKTPITPLPSGLPGFLGALVPKLKAVTLFFPTISDGEERQQQRTQQIVVDILLLEYQ